MTRLLFDGRPVTVDVAARVPALRLLLDGAEREVAIRDLGGGEIEVTVDAVAIRGFRHVTPEGEVHVRLGGRTFFVRPEDRATRAEASGDGTQDIRAELPGRVVARHVEPGAVVAAGDPLLTIESMKLQMTIAAKRGGRVESVSVAAEATFDRGAALVRIVPVEVANDATSTEGASSPPPALRATSRREVPR